MSRKYAKDYRLEEQLSPSGKTRPVAVYQGERYRFLAPETALPGLRLRCTVLSAASALLLFVLLCFSDHFDRDHRFLILPAVFCILPVYLTASSVWTLRTASVPMERRPSDRISNRLPATAGIQTLLSLLAFAAQVVQLFLGGLTWPTMLLAADALLLTAAGAALFSQRKLLRTEAVPSKS